MAPLHQDTAVTYQWYLGAINAFNGLGLATQNLNDFVLKGHCQQRLTPVFQTLTCSTQFVFQQNGPSKQGVFLLLIQILPRRRETK